MKLSILWRLIAKSLGEKSGSTDKEADQVALIRLMMFSSILITNSFIIYNTLRTHHFPNHKTQIPYAIFYIEKDGDELK